MCVPDTIWNMDANPDQGRHLLSDLGGDVDNPERADLNVCNLERMEREPVDGELMFFCCVFTSLPFYEILTVAHVYLVGVDISHHF